MFWRTARYTRTVTLFPYTTRFRCIVAVPPQVEPAADSETEGVGRHPPVEIGLALGEPCGEVEIGLRPEQRRRRSLEQTRGLRRPFRGEGAVARGERDARQRPGTKVGRQAAVPFRPVAAPVELRGERFGETRSEEH